MNADISVWSMEIKWMFGVLLLALTVLSVIVIKRGTVGKGRWEHLKGLLHRLHLGRGA